MSKVTARSTQSLASSATVSHSGEGNGIYHQLIKAPYIKSSLGNRNMGMESTISAWWLDGSVAFNWTKHAKILYPQFSSPCRWVHLLRGRVTFCFPSASTSDRNYSQICNLNHTKMVVSSGTTLSIVYSFVRRRKCFFLPIRDVS